MSGPVDNGDGTFTVTVDLEAVVDSAVPIQAKGATFEAAGSRLRAIFTADNTVKYEKPDNADQWLSLTPLAVVYDVPLDGIAKVVGVPVSNTSALSASENTLETTNVFPGIRASYAAIDGAVRETLTLDELAIASIPRDAKLVQFVWRIEKGAGLTHISHALQGVCAGTVDTPMILRIEPIEARDAAGAYCPGRTEYRNGYVIGSLDAEWLRKAVAPVLVDPTVTANATVDISGGYIVTYPPFYYSPYKCYFKFTLPDVGGGTVIGATVRQQCTVVNTNVTCGAFVSQDVAWDGGSNAATIDAITLGTQLDSETMTTAWTYYYWDVTGDATNGVIKAYAADCDEITIIMRGYNGAVSAVNATLYIQDDSGLSPYEAVFRGYGSPGPSQLAITYTGGSPLQGRPGFAIGGVMPF